MSDETTMNMAPVKNGIGFVVENIQEIILIN